MTELTEYNCTLMDSKTVGKSQYGFRITQTEKKTIKQKDGSAKVVPMSRMDFDGINQGTDKIPIDYETASIVGFPFRVGILSYVIGEIKFYKIGILYRKLEHKK